MGLHRLLVDPGLLRDLVHREHVVRGSQRAQHAEHGILVVFLHVSTGCGSVTEKQAWTLRRDAAVSVSPGTSALHGGCRGGSWIGSRRARHPVAGTSCTLRRPCRNHPSVSNQVRASVTGRTIASMPRTVMRSRKPWNHGADV